MSDKFVQTEPGGWTFPTPPTFEALLAALAITERTPAPIAGRVVRSWLRANPHPEWELEAAERRG